MLGPSVRLLVLCLLLGKGLGFANAGPDAALAQNLSLAAQTQVKGNDVFPAELSSALAASLGQAQALSYF